MLWGSQGVFYLVLGIFLDFIFALFLRILCFGFFLFRKVDF